jgi:hypothetical protein
MEGCWMGGDSKQELCGLALAKIRKSLRSLTG